MLSPWKISMPLGISHPTVGTEFDFPWFVSGTVAALATIANGGFVNNVNGYDITFATDPSGINQLPFQLIKYVPTTGYIEFYVQLPAISSKFDVQYFIVAGNPAITTNQSSTTTWDSDYKGVYHLITVSSALSVADSTSNGNNATNDGATATPALYGTSGAAAFNGSSYIDLGTAFNSLTEITIEAWVTFTGTFTNNVNPYIFCNIDATRQNGFGLGLLPPNNGGNKILFEVWNAGLQVYVTALAALVVGTLYHIVATYSGTGLALYINGVLQNTAGATNYLGAGTVHANIGRWPGGATDYWVGDIQEARISDFARDANYAKSAYNNIVLAAGLVPLTTSLAADYVGGSQPNAMPAPRPITLMDFPLVIVNTVGAIFALTLYVDASTVLPAPGFAAHIGSLHFTVTEFQRITPYGPNIDTANQIWICSLVSATGATTQFLPGAVVTIP